MAEPAAIATRPIDQAFAAWKAWNPGGDFAELVGGYLREAFVYSGDDAFILARPVGNPADTWFVHLAAGRVERFQELAPYRLPFIGWQRRGRGGLRRYSWQRFEQLTH